MTNENLMQPLAMLTRVALRYGALYLDVRREDIDPAATPSAEVVAFVEQLADNGYAVSEELLHALAAARTEELQTITATINDVLGVSLNWMPLVKGWNVPTGESRADHVATLLANILLGRGVVGGDDLLGTTLPCGHFIPDGTFPLERYNGCPFCGRPFATADYVFTGGASRLKELRLMVGDDMRRALMLMLQSPTPLDATQRASLRTLLSCYGLPEGVDVPMRETAMLAVEALVAEGREAEASALLPRPSDVLRYLWYEKTGQLQLLEPRTLMRHAERLNMSMWGPSPYPAAARVRMWRELQLKYRRPECRRVAQWLNATRLSPTLAAADMNPKRGMWVRMIHALRLPEYAQKPGFDHLRQLLDIFYRQDYTTWAGRLNAARRSGNGIAVRELLRERPGVFARDLFHTMLRFGPEPTLLAFSAVADKLPARLLLSIANAADAWFEPEQPRLARPLTGGIYTLKAHKLLADYTAAQRREMVAGVGRIFAESMRRRFAAGAVPASPEAGGVYVDPRLFQVPLGVGDRSTTIQDTACALTGTRFPVEGNAVRLFMQWGKGLPAQHLDMDLSCRILYKDGSERECAYYNLTCPGAKHSGDIRLIPDLVGTAEYIELTLSELRKSRATYVIFTCNAYSRGAISPNLVVGWMDSAFEMRLSEKDGVAYDPSCVQHQVRIGESNLSKGLVFGVLDVAAREITWLEMPFTALALPALDTSSVMALLERLRNKLSIGALLRMWAEAQGRPLVDAPSSATDSFTYEWALDPAAVASLLA